MHRGMGLSDGFGPKPFKLCRQFAGPTTAPGPGFALAGAPRGPSLPERKSA